MKDPFIFSRHIYDSIENIEHFVKGLTKKQFLGNLEKQYAVMRAIEMMGEAVKNLPLSFKHQFPEIPWSGIAGMRDRLIHHYLGINLERVWNVVKEDIPKLKKEINRISKEYN